MPDSKYFDSQSQRDGSEVRCRRPSILEWPNSYRTTRWDPFSGQPRVELTDWPESLSRETQAELSNILRHGTQQPSWNAPDRQRPLTTIGVQGPASYVFGIGAASTGTYGTYDTALPDKYHFTDNSYESNMQVITQTPGTMDVYGTDASSIGTYGASSTALPDDDLFTFNPYEPYRQIDTQAPRTQRRSSTGAASAWQYALNEAYEAALRESFPLPPLYKPNMQEATPALDARKGRGAGASSTALPETYRPRSSSGLNMQEAPLGGVSHDGPKSVAEPEDFQQLWHRLEQVNPLASTQSPLGSSAGPQGCRTPSWPPRPESSAAPAIPNEATQKEPDTMAAARDNQPSLEGLMQEVTDALDIAEVPHGALTITNPSEKVSFRDEKGRPVAIWSKSRARQQHLPQLRTDARLSC